MLYFCMGVPTVLMSQCLVAFYLIYIHESGALIEAGKDQKNSCISTENTFLKFARLWIRILIALSTFKHTPSPSIINKQHISYLNISANTSGSLFDSNLVAALDFRTACICRVVVRARL